ncbi:MAG: regulatory protein RecX [SAR202 cluster bacterium]|nr:regulatory protein RecX [SAR202 cluster bacterium]
MDEDGPFQRAKAAALRLLAQRPRSEAEVRAHLRRRFPPSAVDRAIASLKERGLVDDAAFAASWKERRDHGSPRSASAIRRELRSKGVAGAASEEAVQGVEDEDAAYRAAVKFSRRLEDADFASFHRRLWGHLRRRGFGQSIAARTARRLWDERQARDAPAAPAQG